MDYYLKKEVYVNRAISRQSLQMSSVRWDAACSNFPHLLIELDYKLVKFASHDVYTLAGMPCKWADIMLSGSLVCRISSVSGKQVEVSRLRPGNLIAPAFIFAKDNSMPVSVETETEVTVLRLSPATLQHLLDVNETIRMNYIRVLSNIDVFLTQKMRVLSLFTVREKVAYLLLEQAGEQIKGKEIKIIDKKRLTWK